MRETEENPSVHDAYWFLGIRKHVSICTIRGVDSDISRGKEAWVPEFQHLILKYPNHQMHVRSFLERRRMLLVNEIFWRDFRKPLRSLLSTIQFHQCLWLILSYYENWGSYIGWRGGHWKYKKEKKTHSIILLKFATFRSPPASCEPLVMTNISSFKVHRCILPVALIYIVHHLQ